MRNNTTLFAIVMTLLLVLLSFSPSLTMAQQQITASVPPLLPPSTTTSSSLTTGQTTTSPSPTPTPQPLTTSTQPLTPEEQEQLNRLQNVIAATNLNLDETEKQIGGVVYNPRWSEPVWVEPDSAAVLAAYCLPGEFAESGQEILGGFELEVLESYEVALPQNFTAWMMVIGNEDRQDRLPAAVGVVCASDLNDTEARVVSADEQQQINNAVQQFTTTQVTSIDQVINIINNATTNATGGGGTPPPSSSSSSRDTTPPTLTVPNNMVLQTGGSSPTALLVYSVTAQDNVDGTATLDEENTLTQDNVGGSIRISCSPTSQYFLPVGNRTVECSASDAANNTADASFTVAVIGTTTTPPGGGTTLTASANPAIYNNVLCPSPLVFSGTITDNVGNRDVRYRFIFSTGATTPEQVMHFNQPGSQSVSYTSPGIAPPSLQGWVAIEILQPVQLQSNQAEMEIICSPSTGSVNLGGITASLSANPPIHEGPCPVTIDFRGTITDNVGNRDITYRIDIFSETFFEPDLVIGNEQVIHFDQPGSQSVLRRLGGGDPDIHPSFQGWAVIEILQPVQLASNRAYFEVRCTAFPTLQAENTTALLGNATTLDNATRPEGGGADTTPPTVTVPNNMEVETTTTDPSGGTSVTYNNVRAVDNVDGEAVLEESDIIRQDNVGGSITIACDPPSGSTFPVGVSTTVQCNAYDAAGNVGTASFTVTVTSTTPPQTLQAEEEPAAVEEEAAGEEEGGEEQLATDGEEQEEGEDGDTAVTPPPAADGEQPPAATEEEGAAATAPANGEGGGG